MESIWRNFLSQFINLHDLAIFMFLDPPGILLLVAPSALYWHIIKIQTCKHLDFKCHALNIYFRWLLVAPNMAYLFFFTCVLVAPGSTKVDPPTFWQQIMTYIATNSNFHFDPLLYIITKKAQCGSKGRPFLGIFFIFSALLWTHQIGGSFKLEYKAWLSYLW